MSSTDGHASPVWRSKIQAHDLRHWDGEVVLCNPISGHTHFLDVAGGGLLTRLAEAPMPQAAVCRWLSDFLAVEDDAQVAAAAGNLLASLDELGLIEQVVSC